MYLPSVRKAVLALGPIQPLGDRAATDADDPASKVTHDKLAVALGAELVVPQVTKAALTAICIDSYYETGQQQFLAQADRHWRQLLKSLSPSQAEEVSLHGAAATSYFYHEIAMRRRIDRGDRFAYQELVDHLMRRGSDATIYASLLSMAGLKNRSLVAGFRILQALRDFENDLQDLEHDRRSVGANLLLCTVAGQRRWQKQLADELMQSATRLRRGFPRPLYERCEAAHAAILKEV